MVGEKSGQAVECLGLQKTQRTQYDTQQGKTAAREQMKLLGQELDQAQIVNRTNDGGLALVTGVGVEGRAFWFSWSPRAGVAYQIAPPG